MHKFRHFFILFLLLLLLCGCQRQPMPTDTPTAPPETAAPTQPPAPELKFTISSKSFGEKYGNYYDKKRSLTTDYNGVTYHFDVAVAEEDRLAVILESDRLVSQLMTNFPDMEKNLTICVREDDYAPRTVEHTLYIGLQHFKTQYFALGTAWALFGYDVNYGLVYAQAMEAAEAMGYSPEAIDTSLEDALALTDEAPEFLDLNYACFLPCYADEEILPKIKALAIHFHQYLLDNDRLDLLSDYSDALYSRYLSDFLKENGRGDYSNADLQGTFFYSGGPVMRLIWENTDGVFYLEEAYVAQYQFDSNGDLLNSSYRSLRQLVIDYLLQADFMEARLGHLESDPSGKVDVLFQSEHATDRYSMANYTNMKDLIRMFSAEPFLHEYGHYLMRDVNFDSWLNELICYYYCYTPVDEHTTYMWAGEAARIQSLNPRNENDRYEHTFVSYLVNHLDHEMDWANPEDFAYIYSGYTVITDSFFSLTDPNGGSYAKVSFLRWLIDQVGEEEAIAAITGNCPEEVFGKSWEALISQWEAKIRKDFSWLSQYYYI